MKTREMLIEETAAAIEAMRPEHQDDAVIRATFDLLNTGDVAIHDFEYFAERSLEFFFLPENSKAFCNHAITPKDLCQMLLNFQRVLSHVSHWVVTNELEKYELQSHSSHLSIEQVQNTHYRILRELQIKKFEASIPWSREKS